ncbi:MAG: histidine kinase [Bacteroidota bacterium]
MLHPLLKNAKTLIIYFIIWILVSSIHIMVLWKLIGLTLNLSIYDSVVSNLLFFLFSIGVWYALQYGIDNHNTLYDKLINHSLTGITVITFWLLLDYFILNLITTISYHSFLIHSLPWRVLTGVIYFSIIVMIYYLIVYYEDIQTQIKQKALLDNLLQESRLNALRSQINPHFLFNSLNSISSLTITNPGLAQDIIIKLSEFMRYSLKQGDEKQTTLEQELYHLQQYLEIEKIRFGMRLKFNEDIDEATKDMKLPVMVLQPLVENAIKHGVYNSTEEVKINLQSKISDNKTLTIIIGNDYDKNVVNKKGTGTGLSNISKRLLLLYNNNDLMKINDIDNYFEVTINIPQQ